MNLPPAYKARAMRVMRLGMAGDGDEFVDAADSLLVDGGLDVRRLPKPLQVAAKALIGVLAERLSHDDASAGIRAVANRFGEPGARG